MEDSQEEQPLPPVSAADPKWKVYQKAIADLEKAYDGCSVIHDHKVVGRRSKVERQVDMRLSVSVVSMTQSPSQLNASALKQLPLASRMSMALYGFLDDVAANKAVLISNSGCTSGANRELTIANLELRTITLQEAEAVDWSDFFEGDYCRGGGTLVLASSTGHSKTAAAAERGTVQAVGCFISHAASVMR